MTPTHHVCDELLLERSAAGLPEALDVFVTSHLTLCPICRAREATLDAIGGELLIELPPVQLPAHVLGATLDAITQPPPPTLQPHRDPVLPAALVKYTGPFDAIRWGRRMLGCRRFDLPVAYEGRPARLLQFPAGRTLPTHTHEAVEHSLVLAGGYTDEGRHYIRGDAAMHPPGHTHRPRIDDDGPCVLLLVHGGRLVPQSLWGRPAVWFVDS